MNISNAYLTFRDSDGEQIQVSISDILYSGIPIDEESGDDLELVSEEIEEKKEIVIEKEPIMKITMGELSKRFWTKACEVLGFNYWYLAEGGHESGECFISLYQAEKLGISKEEFNNRAE